MKILTISDTHNKHLQIPKHYLENNDNDIKMLIHAGDVSGRGLKKEIIHFLEWYNNLNFEYKLLIAGNHDFFFEDKPKEEIDGLLLNYPNIIYLNDSGIEIEGIKIWGSPIQPWFYNWAFNRKGHDIQKHWNLIPTNTQILITHGPVENILDLTLDGISAGCPYLKQTIEERLKELELHIAGHIHEAYGHVKSSNITYINASVLDRDYNMQNKPILFDWETKTILDN